MQGEFIDASLLENHYMQSENYKMLRSRMKAIAKDEGGSNKSSMRNPMLKGMANPNVDKGSLSAQEPDALQMDVDVDHKANLDKVGKSLPKVVLALISAYNEIFKRPKLQDFYDSLFKRRILLHRACQSLIRRYELILGSTILHIILALLFAWINYTITPGSNIAFFGIAAMFLIMANVEFIFYIYTSHHVSTFLGACTLFTHY